MLNFFQQKSHSANSYEIGILFISDSFKPFSGHMFPEWLAAHHLPPVAISCMMSLWCDDTILETFHDSAIWRSPTQAWSLSDCESCLWWAVQNMQLQAWEPERMCIQETRGASFRSLLMTLSIWVLITSSTQGCCQQPGSRSDRENLSLVTPLGAPFP